MSNLTEQRSVLTELKDTSLENIARICLLSPMDVLSIYDSAIYPLMDIFCPDYSGGQWTYHALESKNIVIAVPPIGVRRMVSPNGFSADMSSLTAGFTVTAFSVNMRAQRSPEAAELYYRILNAAQDLILSEAQRDMFYAFID